MQNFNILVVNDDGIHSPGLKAAVQGVMELGNVKVIAPTNQQTGMGRGLSGGQEEYLKPIDYLVNDQSIEAYHCDCSPALTVRHALRVLYAKQKPDLVVSGINYGENVGVNISTSGTVGAALESASVGISSLAISKQTDISTHHTYTDQNWAPTVYFLTHFAKLLLFNKMPLDIDVLKVDVPETATETTPWRLTKVARQVYFSNTLKNPTLTSKIGDVNLSIGVSPDNVDADSDIHTLLFDQVVSVTPLSLDLTSRTNFTALQQLLDSGAN